MKKCIGLVAGHSGDSLTDKLRNIGYQVALVGGSENEPGMDNADFILIEDLSNYSKIADFFLNNKVSKVIIGTGHYKAINLANYLNNIGIITNINYEKSLLAKDKIKFKKELININIKTPKFLNIDFDKNIEVEEIINKINIPCVIKSNTDAIQPQKVNIIKNLEDAILQVKNSNTDVLVEEYIKGNDCTVAVVSDGNIIKSLGVTYYSKAKEYKLNGFEGAYSKKVSYEKELELNSIAINIVKELEFKGLSRIDFIIDEKSEEIYVLELNTVIVTGYNGSAYPFFKEQGIDVAEVMIQNSLRLIDEENI